MKLIRDEKGIALVMVLIFSMIGLAIVSAMLFMLTQGTRMSGAFKVFKSADEAGLGATVDLTDMIRNRGVAPALATLTTDAAVLACLQQKLTTASSTWTAACTAHMRSLDPTDNWDMTVDLPGPSGITFKSYTKIVDTVVGNSETSALVTSGGQLGGQGVVSATSGQVSPPSIPYLYRMEVQTQNPANVNEKSRYSVLYAY